MGSSGPRSDAHANPLRAYAASSGGGSASLYSTAIDHEAPSMALLPLTDAELDAPRPQLSITTSRLGAAP